MQPHPSPPPAARPLQPCHTHGIARRSEVTLLKESPEHGWRGLYASLVQESPWEAELPPAAATGIAFSLGTACRVSRAVGGPTESAVLRPQQFSVLPPGRSSRWRIEGSPCILHLYVHEQVLQQVAQDLVAGGARTAVSHRLCVYDPVVAHLAQSAHALLCEGGSHSSYLVDHLAHALATRLVTHHSEAGTPVRGPATVAIPAHRWRDLLDYIEAHLGEDLSLDAMAQRAGVRPTQLWRAFRGNSGRSPHQYVLERRLARVQRQLVEGGEPLAAIAAAAGFSSQSHMASAFRRQFQQTPAEYRRANGGGG